MLVCIHRLNRSGLTMTSPQKAFANLSTDFFKALCDPTRIHILVTLAKENGPCPVSAIAEQCSVDFSVVSRHLSLLKRTGIVTTEKKGREVLYSFATGNVVKSLRACADVLESCCPPSDKRPLK